MTGVAASEHGAVSDRASRDPNWPSDPPLDRLDALDLEVMRHGDELAGRHEVAAGEELVDQRLPRPRIFGRSALERRLRQPTGTLFTLLRIPSPNANPIPGMHDKMYFVLISACNTSAFC